MKSKLAISVTASGYILLAAYIIYDFSERGILTFKHLFYPQESYELFFHILIFLAPFISTVMGYLVNERIKLLTDIRETEAKYRDLYQNAPDGYHSADIDGTILEVNDTWFRMLGYEKQEVVNKMKIRELLHSKEVEAFEESHALFKEKGHIENVAFSFRKKDGSLLPVLINATAIYDKNRRFLRSRSVVRDNSSIKSYEMKLKNAAEEWRITFDSMPYGVMLLDRAFNIIRTNNYMARILNFAARELVGKKCYEIIHGTTEPIKDCPLLKAENSHQTAIIEYYAENLNRHFMMTVTPILDEKGTTKAYVHSLIDITDMKNKEGLLEDSREAFLNMLKDINYAYEDLKDLHNDLLHAFVYALDAKSPWTKGHSERVKNISLSIAREMGLDEDELEVLRMAGLLHDVGKIGTYDTILDKPDKLTPEEFELVKKHPAKGADILAPIKKFEDIAKIIRHHHERIDGKGYPDGLKGEEIPLLSKILCVADSYDSMTSDRPYRRAPGKEYVISELKRCSGTQFDPKVVEALLRVLE